MKRSASPPQPIRRVRQSLARPLVLALAGILTLVLLSACSLHTGADEIAFVQGNQLWTIQSDGNSAQSVSQNGVLDFAWSPDHHQIVFRYTSSGSAVTSGAPYTPPDAPADLAIQSVNGGYALQITPSQRGDLRSAAWWDSSGNRLVYREATTPGSPVEYVVSQADQPVGIARKILLDDASIPAVSSDGKRVAVIDPSGAVRVGATGALGTVTATGALLELSGSGGHRPARVLWQPKHNALLYATASASGIAFVLRDLASGGTRVLAATASAVDAAFSPDGTLLLVRTPTDFELWSAAGSPMPLFAWPETDPLALPWWSPDSRAILVQDTFGWRLVDVAAKRERQVVTYPADAGSPGTPPASATWTPATSDPWSPDGSQVVFAAPPLSELNGTPLARPQHGGAGLYVASVQPDRFTAASLIYSGAPAAPAWGFAVPDTVFLVPGYSR